MTMDNEFRSFPPTAYKCYLTSTYLVKIDNADVDDFTPYIWSIFAKYNSTDKHSPHPTFSILESGSSAHVDFSLLRTFFRSFLF